MSEPYHPILTNKYSEKLLDEARQYLVSKIEKIYNFTYQLPKVEDLLENFELDELEMRLLLSSGKTELNLQTKGLPTYQFEVTPSLIKDKDNEFDPLFITVAGTILDPGDTRSFTAKIKSFKPIGVNSRTWDNWLKIPRYQDYVQKLLDENFHVMGDQYAKLGLMRNLQSGDLQSIKYYNEVTNRYRPQDQNAVNLTMMMALVMEILAKYVPANVLETVAEEFEQSNIHLDAIEAKAS